MLLPMHLEQSWSSKNYSMSMELCDDEKFVVCIYYPVIYSSLGS